MRSTANPFLGPYDILDIEVIMALTANVKLTFSYNSPIQTDIGGSLSIGQDVLAFILQIKTPFDGTTPHATIGNQISPAYYNPADSIDLSEVGTMVIIPENIESVNVVQPRLFLNLVGATQGEAVLYMLYNNGS